MARLRTSAVASFATLDDAGDKPRRSVLIIHNDVTRTALRCLQQPDIYIYIYSTTAPIVTLDLGTSAVSFSEGAVDTSTRRRLSTIDRGGRSGERKPPHKQSRVPRRRLNAVETSATSSISVASVQFNVNGAPSTAVEGGMTSARLASTDDGSVRAWHDV